MNAAGEAEDKKDTLARGAKPRPEGPVRERGWRPTRNGCGIYALYMETARRRAIRGTADSRTSISRIGVKEAVT